ncbi:universal stress protein [Streptomyces sp. M41]|uniref:universal stress protein n=1 Tax=Streptomyces sp. M41 TaxID=3059412 RepID=UPI00374D82CF
MTLQHVAVGMDGSTVSVRALDQAADEAYRRGVRLRVVYAVADRDAAGPVLACAAARVRERCPALSVQTVAREGGAVETLTRASADATLTVVGTRGLGALTGLVCGAVTRRLVAQVRGPLLVVRGDRPHDDRREVLLGVESDLDADAAVYAMEDAERRGARLRVLHSWAHRRTAPPEAPSPLSATRIGGLRGRHPGVQVKGRTVRTAAAHALVEASRQAAVVVIATHRGRRPGPAAHALLHHAHCPVVVVPSG